MWNESSRLIANAVIYYNSLVLSEALDEFERRGDFGSPDLLKRVSPVAWQHINFYGKYEFKPEVDPIDISFIRECLSAAKVSRLSGS